MLLKILLKFSRNYNIKICVNFVNLPTIFSKFSQTFLKLFSVFDSKLNCLEKFSEF